jgi:peroxiredoxin
VPVSEVVVSEKELAPNFTLTDIDGNTFTLSNHRGKVVLIIFTATQSPYDKDMQIQLNVVRDNFSEQELVMISIFIFDSDTIEEIRDFKLYFEGDWTYAKDTQNLKATYDIVGTPTECIVDVNGYVHSVLMGYREWGDLAEDIEDAKTGYEPPESPQTPLDFLPLVIVIVVIVVSVIMIVVLLYLKKKGKGSG